MVLMLLLGLFNVLNFTPNSTTIGLGFGDISVGVQPLSLLLTLLYCLLNQTSVSLFVRRLLPVPSAQQAASRHRHRIDQFKQTFARKSDDDLRLIVQERRLVPDAIAAAQELMRERNKALPTA